MSSVSRLFGFFARIIGGFGKTVLGRFVWMFSSIKSFGFWRLFTLVVVLAYFYPSLVALFQSGPQAFLLDIASRLVASENHLIGLVDRVKEGVSSWELLLVYAQIFGATYVFRVLLGFFRRSVQFVFSDSSVSGFGPLLLGLVILGLLEWAFLGALTGSPFSLEAMPFRGFVYLVANAGVLIEPVSRALGFAPANQTVANATVNSSVLNVSL